MNISSSVPGGASSELCKLGQHPIHFWFWFKITQRIVFLWLYSSEHNESASMPKSDPSLELCLLQLFAWRDKIESNKVFKVEKLDQQHSEICSEEEHNIIFSTTLQSPGNFLFLKVILLYSQPRGGGDCTGPTEG